MSSRPTRRSHRVKTVDLNGRGYLAHAIGFTVEQLDEWLQSVNVQPHLQLWFKLCVNGVKRYNHILALINQGEFQKQKNEFEEEMLLSCLGEGHISSTRFQDEQAKTKPWTTTEIWARTAWRIVHANLDESQAFHGIIKFHPSRCYAIVIDLLCIAFHSIAHREVHSIYRKLILTTVRHKKAKAVTITATQAPTTTEEPASHPTMSTPSRTIIRPIQLPLTPPRQSYNLTEEPEECPTSVVNTSAQGMPTPATSTPGTSWSTT